MSKLNEGKTITIPIGKERLGKIAQAKVSTNFKNMVETKTEVHLGGTIGNVVTEESTCEKSLKEVEWLGVKSAKENFGLCGRAIVAIMLL